MVLFYHTVGVVLLILGSTLLQSVVTDYKEPGKPISVISVIFAGPVEETLFFGIPFYATGNNIVVMAGGILWAMWHLFGSTVQLNSLAYANWLFVLPSIFLSFRTWISGKGWFAVVAHSSWNIFFFSLGCATGEVPCKLIYDNAFSDIITVIYLAVAGVLVLITYFLYRGKQGKLRYVF